jgi:secondary thiamine-phosphate synthase enzyme
MGVETATFFVESAGFSDVVDVTGKVEDVLADSDLTSGIALIFVAGSTASITTIEFETGAVSDLQRALEHLAPRKVEYEHNLRWHDGNGFAHVRAAMLGSGFSVPFVNGKLLLGTWQQLVLVDHDNRPRRREVIVQLVGE